MNTATLKIAAGNHYEYVEMPGVTAMWSAAMRVAEHVGVFEEDREYRLLDSVRDFIPEGDIAASWTDQTLHLYMGRMV